MSVVVLRSHVFRLFPVLPRGESWILRRSLASSSTRPEEDSDRCGVSLAGGWEQEELGFGGLGRFGWWNSAAAVFLLVHEVRFGFGFGDCNWFGFYLFAVSVFGRLDLLSELWTGFPFSLPDSRRSAVESSR